MSKNLELGDRDMGENSFRCQLERQPGIPITLTKPKQVRQGVDLPRPPTGPYSKR